ncbi:MAG TPA: SHOCT domain-containing protein [Opitutaceae bacterium]|nr:SHOCT domain-containing protein [Opitutaceae bacterium]
MKAKITALALFFVALLAGCSTADKLNQIQIGMTKDQVITILGAPDSTSAQANVEYLTYYLEGDPGYGRDRPYMVRVVDGKVESFGRLLQLWDLYNRPVGSAQNPATVAPAAVAPAPVDLAGQLEKLKALKDQGVLTDEEFQKAKDKLLAPQK